MVVVPTMLSSPAGVEDLLEGLEVRYLANRDDNLHFALLTDFDDAPDGDPAGGRRAGAAGPRRHRAAQPEVRGASRRHLPSSSTARAAGMPREGRVDGLRAQARQAGGVQRAACAGRGASAFSEVVGDTDRAAGRALRHHARHRHAAAARCGARSWSGRWPTRSTGPCFDAARGRVVDGYGILQPRVGVSLPSARRSWFVRLFAGDAGIDPYTRVVSDVYQDLFGEGSFIGKGIYDVDAFEQTLAATSPRTAILSHDLLEGALRPLGPAQRRGAVRGLPRRATRPTSAGGTAGCAATGRSRAWLLPRVPRAGRAARRAIRSRRCRGGRSSTTCAAASCPLAMLALLLVAWLLAARRRGASRRCSCWRSSAPCRCCRCWRELVPQARPTCRCWRTCALTAGTLGTQLGAGAFDARLPAVRRATSASTRSCRTLARMLVDASAACWSGRPPATPSAAAAHDLPGFVPVDVVRAGACRRGDRRCARR